MGTESSKVEFESNKGEWMTGYAMKARKMWLPRVRKGPR
jgi:hypothetical protein